MVAEVIINLSAKSINKTFDYLIPDSILKDLKIGSRVLVPFGKNKQEEGFVVNIKNKSEFECKEIIKVEDSILTNDNIELAKLMSRRYFCNISECIKLMLPPGMITKNISNRIKEKTANFVYKKKDKDEIEFLIETGKIKSDKHLRILNFLMENEGITIPDLVIFTDTSPGIINTLENKGLIEIIEQKVERNPFMHKDVKKDNPLELTKEQKIAYNKIVKSKYNEFLIYGITGSRKNRSVFAAYSKCIK